MPKLCAVFGCRGNYKGQPYNRLVRFPTDENERLRWIAAMSNASTNLKHRRDIFVCALHFECEWVTREEAEDQLDNLYCFLVYLDHF